MPIYPTPTQKILNHFLEYPEGRFYGAELQKKLHLSAGATHDALQRLYRVALVTKTRQGKTIFYVLNETAPGVRSHKIIHAIETVQPLIASLARDAAALYLFGSSARGEYISESDIDLAVVCGKGVKERIEERIAQTQSAIRRPLQAVVYDEMEWASLEDKDPDFYNQITRGIHVWSRPSTYGSEI